VLKNSGQPWVQHYQRAGL